MDIVESLVIVIGTKVSCGEAFRLIPDDDDDLLGQIIEQHTQSRGRTHCSRH